MDPVAEYTHVQNARSENAIRVSKEHVRCLLRASNVPRNFWPYALTHFLRLGAYFIVRLILKIALHGNACMRLIPTTKFGMT